MACACHVATEAGMEPTDRPPIACVGRRLHRHRGTRTVRSPAAFARKHAHHRALTVAIAGLLPPWLCQQPHGPSVSSSGCVNACTYAGLRPEACRLRLMIDMRVLPCCWSRRHSLWTGTTPFNMNDRGQTILERFRALRPWQRILLGVMGMTFSTVGFFITDPERADYTPAAGKNRRKE